MELKGGQEVVGNRGPARSGATSAWFGEVRVRNGAPGCIWELSGSVSGSFRGPQSRSLEPSERPLLPQSRSLEPSERPLLPQIHSRAEEGAAAAWFGDPFGLRNFQT